MVTGKGMGEIGYDVVVRRGRVGLMLIVILVLVLLLMRMMLLMLLIMMLILLIRILPLNPMPLPLALRLLRMRIPLGAPGNMVPQMQQPAQRRLIVRLATRRYAQGRGVHVPSSTMSSSAIRQGGVHANVIVVVIVVIIGVGGGIGGGIVVRRRDT